MRDEDPKELREIKRRQNKLNEERTTGLFLQGTHGRKRRKRRKGMGMGTGVRMTDDKVNASEAERGEERGEERSARQPWETPDNGWFVETADVTNHSAQAGTTYPEETGGRTVRDDVGFRGHPLGPE
ncbi:hypothetical protein I7I51_05971 [Histoplasma capsulatum]|uniref:Uncharacterized protein n=1 Tax=Ajellomyces capsulatus TaxID=5037 RepID=A0A8A1MJ26_AJECA|nr:predicted protein [Histoplasma mississippiense (nom. inval.)]EDN05603.1 predicted protein [Histoplasma mississippiense (nom. inval.)]QSS65130.1 hypothetical protein I7I51_05971 [Histoplasma capsulatum]